MYRQYRNAIADAWGQKRASVCGQNLCPCNNGHYIALRHWFHWLVVLLWWDLAYLSDYLCLCLKNVVRVFDLGFEAKKFSFCKWFQLQIIQLYNDTMSWIIILKAHTWHTTAHKMAIYSTGATVYVHIQLWKHDSQAETSYFGTIRLNRTTTE